MNEVFVIGKVVSRVEFDFLINSKKISKASCYLKLNNKSIIEINGFNNVADYMYGCVKEKDDIFIYGKLINDKIYVKNIRRSQSVLT